MFRPISICRRQLLPLQPPLLSIRHIAIRRVTIRRKLSGVDGPAAEERSQHRSQPKESPEKIAPASQNEWRHKESDLKPEVHVYRPSSLQLRPRPSQDEEGRRDGRYRPHNSSPRSDHQLRRVYPRERKNVDYRPYNSAQEPERRPERSSFSRHEEERRSTRREDNRRLPRHEEDNRRLPRREEDYRRLPRREEDNRRLPRREEDNRRLPRREEDYRRLPRREEDNRRLPHREAAYREIENKLMEGGLNDRGREPEGEDEKHPHNSEWRCERPQFNPSPRSYNPRSASGLRSNSFPIIYKPGNPFSHAVSATNTRSVVVIVSGTCLRDGRGSPQAGIGCYFGPGSPHNIQRRLGLLFDNQRQKDQRAEIGSALAALKVLSRELGEDVTVSEIIVATNSICLHHGMTERVQKWKAAGWLDSRGHVIPNSDLLEELEEVTVGLEKEGFEVKFWLVSRRYTDVVAEMARQGCLLPLREVKLVKREKGEEGVEGVEGVEGEKGENGENGEKKGEKGEKGEKAGRIGVWGWGGVAVVVVSLPALIALEWPLL